MSNFSNTLGSGAMRSELTGLTAVVIERPTLGGAASPADIRLAVEMSLLSGKHELGLKASSKKSFTALWAGSGVELKWIKSFYARKSSGMHQANVFSLGDTELDWLSGYGYPLITKAIRLGDGLVTFFFSLSGEGVTRQAAANLGRLRQQARQDIFHVVAFVVVADAKFSPDSLRGMVDRMVVVKPCEPDPEWDWAFSTEFVSQGYFDATRSKMMCQLSASPGQHPRAVFEPYLHDSSESRLQWHLRKHGVMNKDIAADFGVSGSTITRALQHLPKYSESWKTAEEVRKLFVSVLGEDVSPPVPLEKVKKRVVSDLLGDVEDDDCFDLDD